MIPCRLVSGLASALPWLGLRDYLLLRHAERCPRCETNLISKVEARSWLIAESEVEDNPAFWTAVKDKIRGRTSGEVRRPLFRYPLVRRWAAIVAFGFLVLAGTWLILKPGADRFSPEAAGPVRFRLNSLTIDGRPIDPVIIQPRDSDLVIIWADMNH